MQISRWSVMVVSALLLSAAGWIFPAIAQPGGNAGRTGDDDAWINAILATPNQKTPVPQDNEFATAPGLEQETPTPQFTVNALAPLLYNSNPTFRRSGGPQSLEGSPVTSLSWASQVFGTPVRASGTASLEWERFPNANDASVDYFRSSARLQYVSPNDDQGFSPFFAYVPRMDFEPTFGNNFATRQDLNLGFDQTFHFDGAFNRVPASANSSSDTVWSFGISVNGQRRIRDVAPQSWAIRVAPSAAWVISPDWNASLALPITRRWFNGSSRDLTIEPVGVLEYIIPANWLGGPQVATILGNPAVDFLAFHEQNWSSEASFEYSQWRVGLVLKAGWRF